MPIISKEARARLKPIILTAAIFGITVTGTWFGAGLRMQGQMKQRAREAEEATISAKIKQLEDDKQQWLNRRLLVEIKLQQLQKRKDDAIQRESRPMRGRAWK